MNRLRACLLAGGVGVLLSACSSSLAGSAILEVDGSPAGGIGAVTSSDFSPAGKWDLKFSWDCARQISERQNDVNRFAISVLNADDASADYEHPLVRLTGSKGGQTLHFTRSGIYFLSINTPCDYTARVYDLSSGGTA